MGGKVLKIPWTTEITNVKVLFSINKEQEVLTTVKKRKTRYLGYIMMNEKYEYSQLLIKVREIGRQRLSSLQNTKQRTGLNDIQTLIHTARDRQGMKTVIANIH